MPPSLVVATPIDWWWWWLEGAGRVSGRYGEERERSEMIVDWWEGGELFHV